MKTTRRKFVAKTGLVVPGLLAGLNTFSLSRDLREVPAPLKENTGGLKISIFSKNLQWLNYEEMAGVAADTGFDGIDLTVRPNGHVLPERVEEDLPKAVEAIRNKGLEVYMITTAITNAVDPYTGPILKAASQAGIKNYRLGWFTYNKMLSIPKNIESFNNAFIQLQKLNKQYSIHGDYQNHAGEGFGSPVLDLFMVLKDIDPKWIGCQYDIRHATVEGANSWPVGFNMLRDYVKTINIKDFQWAKKEGAWKEENVPLGEGAVNFKKYFELLKSANFNGPVCVHYEYPLGGAENGERKLSIARDVVTQAMHKDLVLLKQWLKEVSL